VTSQSHSRSTLWHLSHIGRFISHYPILSSFRTLVPLELLSYLDAAFLAREATTVRVTHLAYPAEFVLENGQPFAAIH